MPENARNTNASDVSTSVTPYKDRAFDLYLTFKAIGGMVVSDTGGIKAMTIGEFCEEVSIDEKTTWRWKTQIPNFAMMVRQRRSEIFPLARETAALNRLFLIGMTSLPTGFKEIETTKTSRDGSVTVTKRRVPTGALHNDQRAAVDALKTALGHDGDLRLPVQRQEHDVGEGLADLLQMGRAKFTKDADSIQEGTVIDAESS